MATESQRFETRYRQLNFPRDIAENYPRIVITITSADPSVQLVRGFLHLWCMYVRGFNFREHCQKAFRGRLSRYVTTRGTRVSVPFTFDEEYKYDSLYICGVARGPVSQRSTNNLHLALEPRLGSRFTHYTYNGYLLSIRNAAKLPIPELPERWQGLSAAYTRCCNFRFCAYRFGYWSPPVCAIESEDMKSDLKMPQSRCLQLDAGS
jgi:hypothetical protein